MKEDLGRKARYGEMIGPDLGGTELERYVHVVGYTSSKGVE